VATVCRARPNVHQILCSMSLDSGRPSAHLESQASTSASLRPPTTPETNRTRPDVQPTPFKSKTHSVTGHSSSPPLNTAHKDYITFWANRLRGNSRICHNIEYFLAEFVPCDEPVPSDPPGWNLFMYYKPDGRTEDCNGMVRFTT
jgi:hypothetical protein